MPDFLLELQVEDIPARFLRLAQGHLAVRTKEMLAAQRITHKSCDVWVSARRLVISIKAVAAKTEAIAIKVYGPKVESLKDAQGAYLPIVLGFAKGKGVLPERLFLEDVPQGKRAGFKKTEPARDVLALLKEGLPAIVFAIPFPKTMRWQTEGPRFARPIRGVLAFWDKKALMDWRFVTDVKPSRVTVVAGKRYAISAAADYAPMLKQAGLILDIDDRMTALRKAIERVVRDARPAALDFEALLDETLLLSESPEPLLGSFDPDYLQLPKEVVLALLGKVKIFGLEGKDGKLKPGFLTIVQAPVGKAARGNIRGGYERLVAAKLFDAKFFWDQDQRKPLEEYAQKLKGIVFSKELGTLWDKVERVRAGSRAVAAFFAAGDPPLAGRASPEPPARGAADAHSAEIDRVALLYKADLATTLVGEYADLAGRVGSFYAQASGEPAAVVAALKDASAATLGEGASVIAAVVAVVDRLDTLLAQFAIGNRPQAKEDPLGLKKTADSVIDIFSRFSKHGSLKEVIGVLGNSSKAAPDLLEFLRGRLALRLGEKGYAPDRVQAVVSVERSAGLPVRDIEATLAAFSSLEGDSQEAIASLSQTFKRAANILKQSAGDPPLAGRASPEALRRGAAEQKVVYNGNIDVALFKDPAEAALWERLSQIEGRFEQDLKVGGYRDALKRLAGLAQPLEDFFKGVMVLCDDQDLKKNRLALLAKLHRLVLQVLDPSKLTLKG